MIKKIKTPSQSGNAEGKIEYYQKTLPSKLKLCAIALK